MKNKILEQICLVFGFITIVVLLSFLMAYPVMWLFNYLSPVLFGGKIITAYNAWALNILCSFLFKSNYKSNSK